MCVERDGGYSSSRFAGRGSGGWDHSWQPKKWDKEHEWNCTVCGESNCHDRARRRGCKEHVGKLLQKKKSSGQRQAQQRQRHGSVVGPRSHQRYTAREDKCRHTETLQALEKTIEAMGDNENTTGVHNTHRKGMQRHSKEAQQTTKELKEANAKTEGDKIKEKDLEQGKTRRRRHGRGGCGVRRIFERQKTEPEKTGIKVDEHGEPTTAVKQKSLRNGSRQNKRASGQEKKDDQRRRHQNAAAAPVEVPT